MTKEESRLTLQDNFGVIASEYPERVVEALRVAIRAFSESSFIFDVDSAAKQYAQSEYPDEPSIGQFGTGDYEQPVDMEYPREIANDSFKAGAEWYAQKMYRLKELADRMYEAAQYLSTDASQLRKAMKEYHNYRISLRNESK